MGGITPKNEGNVGSRRRRGSNKQLVLRGDYSGIYFLIHDMF